MHEDPGEPLHATLTITDSDLDDEEREAMARRLFLDLRGGDIDGVEVHRPLEDAPLRAKSLGTQVLGVVAALISANGLRAFFDYLIERSRGREISVELELGDDKIKLTARTQEELILAYQAAARMIEGRR